MHRIDGAGHLNNRFAHEDAGANRPPTEITAAILNAFQEELAAAIEWAGLLLDKTDNTQLRQALVRKTVAAGKVGLFAGTSAPIGWLKANGAAVSRSAYAELFEYVGTRFGAGDGSETFNIPDLRGEFLRGWDDGRGIDTARVLGTAQDDCFRSHSHQFVNEYDTVIDRAVGYSDENDEGVDSANGVGNRAFTYLTINSAGGLETRPRNIALLVCIKY